jgi:hypothetical protein
VTALRVVTAHAGRPAAAYRAEDTKGAELEAEAIQLGALRLMVAAVPGRARDRELTGPDWPVTSD